MLARSPKKAFSRLTLIPANLPTLPCSWALLLLLTVSVALRSEANSNDGADHPSSALHHYPWLECLTPLWLLDLLYAGVAGYVAANTIAGRFVMAPTQGLCFALLVAALAGSTVAEMLLTGDHRCGEGGRRGRGIPPCCFTLFTSSARASVRCFQPWFPVFLTAVGAVALKFWRRKIVTFEDMHSYCCASLCCVSALLTFHPQSYRSAAHRHSTPLCDCGFQLARSKRPSNGNATVESMIAELLPPPQTS